MFGLMIHKIVENLRQTEWRSGQNCMCERRINYTAKLMHRPQAPANN